MVGKAGFEPAAYCFLITGQQGLTRFMVIFMKPPEFTPINQLPEEVIQSLKHIMAYMVNSNSTVLNIEMKDNTVGAMKLPDFEFSVRRTEG